MTNSICSLNDIKQYAGLSSIEVLDDGLLNRLSDAVASYMQNAVQRTIASASYTETYNGTGTRAIVLRNGPVTAVSSLTIDYITQRPSSSTNPFGYAFDDSMLYLTGARFTHGFQNIVVGYTGGYAIVPPDWKQAHIELVLFKYKAKDRIGLVSMTSDQVATTAYIQSEVPPEVRAVLNQYKRVTV